MDSTAAAESRFSLLDAFKAQDLASVAAMVPAIVALAVICSKDPTTRPFSVYDATISYPYKSVSAGRQHIPRVALPRALTATPPRIPHVRRATPFLTGSFYSLAW